MPAVRTRTLAHVLAALFFTLLVLGATSLARADRANLTERESLNESGGKKPHHVKLGYQTVTSVTSVTLTSLTGASEIAIQNLYDAVLCVKVANSGTTCTATCAGDHVELQQDGALTIPIPKGTSAETVPGYSSSFGSVCAILKAASGNGLAVNTVERDGNRG
jgi:hypothetical protein